MTKHNKNCIDCTDGGHPHEMSYFGKHQRQQLNDCTVSIKKSTESAAFSINANTEALMDSVNESSLLLQQSHSKCTLKQAMLSK